MKYFGIYFKFQKRQALLSSHKKYTLLHTFHSKLKFNLLIILKVDRF